MTFTSLSVQTTLLVAMAAAGMAVLARGRRSVVGTTLVSAWYWAIASWLALAGSEALIAAVGAATSPAWTVPLRFAAAMSTFCTTMAVLGAKRPQDRAWQFIVLSLWFILSLPSVEWLLFGGPQEIHPARFWFLAILVGVGALNGAGTRFWPTSLAYCGGQVALLAPLMADRGQFDASWWPAVGLSLILTSWLLPSLGIPPAARAATGVDRAWLDFRDAFGAVWGLRVCERINASATMYDWPVTLAWRGFRSRTGGPATEPIPQAVEESLRTLLRRFVDPEWLDARLSPESRQNPEPAASV